MTARNLLLMPQDPELPHMAAAASGQSPDARRRLILPPTDTFVDSFEDVLIGRLAYGPATV